MGRVLHLRVALSLTMTHQAPSKRVVPQMYVCFAKQEAEPSPVEPRAPKKTAARGSRERGATRQSGSGRPRLDQWATALKLLTVKKKKDAGQQARTETQSGCERRLLRSVCHATCFAPHWYEQSTWCSGGHSGCVQRTGSLGSVHSKELVALLAPKRILRYFFF